MTYICLNCGKEGTSNYSGQRYCCYQCREQYRDAHRRPVAPYEKCRFNDGVACEGGDCDHCGWNPVVEKWRRRRI